MSDVRTATLLLLCACTSYVPRPLDPEAAAARFAERRLDSPEVRQWFVDHHREWPAGAWTREDLWLATQCLSPQLAAARAKVEAAAAAIGVAAQRPNPEFAFSPEWSANPDPGTSPWVLGATLTFPIELGDKRAVQKHLAELERDGAALAAAGELWVARERLWLADAADAQAAADAELAGRELAAAGRQRHLVEARFAAGATDTGAVEQAGAEQAAAGAALQAAVRATAAARTALAAAVGLSGGALDGLAVDHGIPDRQAVARAELRRTALHCRTDVQQALLAYAIEEDRLRLEVEKQYPDLRLGPGYLYDQGQNKIQFGVSFELPLFHGNDAAIAAATAQRTAAEHTFAAVQVAAFAEVDERCAAHEAALQAMSDAERRWSERRTALQRAERRRDSGLDDAFAVAAAERSVLAAEHDWLAALRSLQQAGVALETSIGAPLPAPPTDPNHRGDER